MDADMQLTQQFPVTSYSTYLPEEAPPQKRQKRHPEKSREMNRWDNRNGVESQHENQMKREPGQEDEVNNFKGCWRPFRDRWNPTSGARPQTYQMDCYGDEGAAPQQYPATGSQWGSHHQSDVDMDVGNRMLDPNAPSYRPSSGSSSIVPPQQSHSQSIGQTGPNSGSVNQHGSLQGVPGNNLYGPSFSNSFGAPNPYMVPFQQQQYQNQQQQQQQHLQSIPQGVGYNLFGIPPLANVNTPLNPFAFASAAAFMDIFGQQQGMNSQSSSGLPVQGYPSLTAPTNAESRQAIKVENNTRGVTPQRPKRPPPLVAPVPTKEYMVQASKPPKPLSSPQPLLVILDLNGTLVCRKHRRLPPSFAKRSGLDEFLKTLLEKYTVMIWSSSQPITVKAVCEQLFPGRMRDALAAEWGRDKFGLTHSQYKEKIQVYKILEKVWGAQDIQSKYPRPEIGVGKKGLEQQSVVEDGKGDGSNAHVSAPKLRWDQSNTILIDDSKLKAVAQPYNILEIPEFKNDSNVDESGVFDVVLKKLEILAKYDDVSQMFRYWEMKRQQRSGDESPGADGNDGGKAMDLQDNGDNISEASAGPTTDTATTVPTGAAMTKRQRAKARKVERKAASLARKKEKKASKQASRIAANKEATATAIARAEVRKTTKSTSIPSFDGAASPSPASGETENFLLDRLEESLAVSPGQSTDSPR